MIPEGNATYMTDELRKAGLLTPEWTELEPKIFENLAWSGATGSAAVPIALDYGWKTGRDQARRPGHAARDRDEPSGSTAGWSSRGRPSPSRRVGRTFPRVSLPRSLGRAGRVAGRRAG